MEEGISKKDVEDNFIVLHNYGENGELWPRCTVVLSTVTITRNNKETKSKKETHRNEPGGKHAEECFLEALRENIGTGKVNKVKAELVQNYSPCSKCAMGFLNFKKEIERRKGEVILTIRFANFYNFHKEPQKTENKSGLVNLSKNDVKLEVFQGERCWEELLNETDMKRTDMKDLLELAMSPQRKDRENKDKKILKGIRSDAQGK